jgi:hypothetical protein
MKTNFTTGPWFATGPHIDQMCFARNYVCSIGRWFVGSNAEHHGDGEATVRLIAAAPELLEFAIRVASGQFGETKGEFISNRIEEATKVIAKAIGEKEVQP